MATNGILKFQGTNKATFVGATSNVVIDTVKSSLGIGVDVNGPTSNLHVVGNAYVSTELTVGGTVTAAGFAGNASTATKLAASVNIGGVAFDGSAAIVPTTFGAATFSGLVSTKTSREFEFTGSESAAYARHFWICSFKDAPGEHTNQLIKINYSATYKRTTGSHTRNSIASGTVTFSDLWKMSTNGNASDVQYYTLQDQKNELYYGQGRLPKWYYVRFNDIGYLVLSMSISDSNSANWYVKGNIDFLSRPGTESGENIWNGTIFRDSDTATTEGFTAISSLYPTSGTGEVGWDTSMASGSTAQTFLEATEGTIFKHGNVGIGTTSPATNLNIQGDSGGVPPTTGGEGTSNGIFRVRDNYNVALDIGTNGSSPWTTWLQVADATSMGTEYPLSLQPNGGNVGIGTTSPGHPLDVQFTGDSGIRSKNTGSSHASVYIDSATGYSYLRFEHSGAAKFWIQSTPTGDLAFRPSGGGHVMDILNNGNVGIGTSSPNASLHIDGSLINTAKIQLLQKLVTITGGNNQLHAIQQGMQVYITDSRSTWQKYQFASDSQWLIGLLGTDMINGGSASNADMTISCKCDVTAFLISSTSGWNGVTMTGWNSLGTVASIMDGYTSTFEIWAKTLSAGTHSFDTYSAMYAFTI